MTKRLKKLVEDSQLNRFENEYNVYDIGEIEKVEDARKELLLTYPDVLDILEKIHQGDSAFLEVLIKDIKETYGFAEELSTVQFLRRMQDMCKLVEEKL